MHANSHNNLQLYFCRVILCVICLMYLCYNDCTSLLPLQCPPLILRCQKHVRTPTNKLFLWHSSWKMLSNTLIMNSVCLVLIGRFPPSQGHLVEHSQACPVCVTPVISHQILFHSKAVLFG